MAVRPGGGEGQDQPASKSASSGNRILAADAASLLCSRVVGRAETALWGLFHKTTILVMKAPLLIT